jgi:hypothetical protein
LSTGLDTNIWSCGGDEGYDQSQSKYLEIANGEMEFFIKHYLHGSFDICIDLAFS